MVYIVIPHRATGTDELRYTLRSLEANFKVPVNVIVSGDCPAWLQNVTKVDNEYKHSMAQLDCDVNIYTALEYVNGTEFYLWNDDFIMLKPATHILPYHAGKLKDVMLDKMLNPATAPSANDMARTLIYLDQLGYHEALAYTLHIPVLYNKANYIKLHQRIRQELKMHTLLPRTLYGNMYNLGGKQQADNKLYDPNQPLPNSMFISTWEHTLNGTAWQAIKAMYPNKSKYER